MGRPARPSTRGVKRERELEHDLQVFGRSNVKQSAWNSAGADDRVVLDYEAQREYQTWLHERDRGP